MIVVRSIKKTFDMCPTRFEGLTDGADEVHVHYRNGWLSIDIGSNATIHRFIDTHMTMEKMKDWVEKLKDEGASDEVAEKMLESHKNILEHTLEAFGGSFSYDWKLSYERLVNQTRDIIQWPACESE